MYRQNSRNLDLDSNSSGRGSRKSSFERSNSLSGKSESRRRHVGSSPRNNKDSLSVSRSKTHRMNRNHSMRVSEGEQQNEPAKRSSLIPPSQKWMTGRLGGCNSSHHELFIINEVSEPSRMLSSRARITGTNLQIIGDRRSANPTESMVLLTGF